jgi:hypothetical protein
MPTLKEQITAIIAHNKSIDSNLVKKWSDEYEWTINNLRESARKRTTLKNEYNLKKGDFITAGIGSDSHPAIIVKIIDNKVYALICSTSELHGVQKCNSRLMHGYYTSTVVLITVEQAKAKWNGVYDNMSEFRRVLKLIKLHYNKIL